MRLGKTLVAIRACGAKETQTHLVVAPLTVLDSWQEELAAEGITNVHKILSSTHTPGDQYTDYAGWFLTNYECVRSHPDLAFQDEPWDAVILDESSRIKNPKAEIAKVCNRGFRDAAHRFILSGLPAPEHPLDYCEQFRFLFGHCFNRKNYWSVRRSMFKQVGFEWCPMPGVRTHFKDYIHDRAFVMSRKEAGLGNKKIFERRVVEPTAEQTRLMKKVASDWQTDGSYTKWRTVVHTWLAQLAGGFSPDGKCVSTAKIWELVNLLKSELRKEQVVVFFRFNRELNAVWQALKKEGISTTWITGKTKLEDRKTRRLLFKRGRRRVALLQAKCARYGLDFSKASTAIFFSNYYDLDARKQAEDRIEHPLKKEPLLYIDLTTRGSLDEDCVWALNEKNIVARFFLSKMFHRWRERLAA